jgi:hypothetical protein
VPRACYCLDYSPLPVYIQTAVCVIFISIVPFLSQCCSLYHESMCNTKSLQDNPYSLPHSSPSDVSCLTQEQILALSSLRNYQQPKKRVLPEDSGPTLEEHTSKMLRASERVRKDDVLESLPEEKLSFLQTSTARQSSDHNCEITSPEIHDI